MFKFNQLKSLHIELSTRCQASCPMCGRNNHGGLPNPNLKLTDMSFDLFKTIVNKEVLVQIKHYCFCGNFGDPIINDDLINICNYLKTNSPDCNVHIHTNGGARNDAWWKNLKDNLPKNHCVFFAIDGLEDTHHLYRIGTTYEKVTQNAKTFIDAGGTSEWVFIKFKHNEHQVEEARDRSKKLGFSRFTVKNTIRFIGENKFSVVNKDGVHQYNLEPPSDNKVVLVDISGIKKFRDDYKNATIDCYAKKHFEVYIDAHGKMFPCCFIAQAPYSNPNDRHLVADLKQKMKDQYKDLVDDLGGEDNIDLSKVTIKEIIEDQKYQSVWSKYWGEEKLIICAKSCGNMNISKPKEQIIKNFINQ